MAPLTRAAELYPDSTLLSGHAATVAALTAQVGGAALLHEELLGFGAALLGGGTATLVAPVVPVPDAATVPLMRAYHELLRGGRPPAEALAAAQADLDSEDTVSWAAAAAFICLGAGQGRRL